MHSNVCTNATTKQLRGAAIGKWHNGKQQSSPVCLCGSTTTSNETGFMNGALNHLGLHILRLDTFRGLQTTHVSKRPMFPTMVFVFIFFTWANYFIMLKLLVERKRSFWSRSSSIVAACRPSIHACRGQIGSHSVTSTRAPHPHIARAQPFQHRHSRR